MIVLIIESKSKIISHKRLTESQKNDFTILVFQGLVRSSSCDLYEKG